MSLPGRLLLASFLLLCAGCTTYLYQGETIAPDSCGRQRRHLLYWTRTEPLIGIAETSPAHLFTECSADTSVTLVDQPDGIVFRGIPGRDLLPGPPLPINPDQECGRVSNYSTLLDVGTGPLLVNIYCLPVIGPGGTISARNYPAARREPYNFPIVEKAKRFSWRREPLPAPSPPLCRESAR